MKYCINCEHYRDNDSLYNLATERWCALDEKVVDTPIRKIVRRGNESLMIERNRNNNCAGFKDIGFFGRLFSTRR